MAQSPYWKCMGPRVPIPREGRLNFLVLSDRPNIWCIEALSVQHSH